MHAFAPLAEARERRADPKKPLHDGKDGAAAGKVDNLCKKHAPPTSFEKSARKK